MFGNQAIWEICTTFKHFYLCIIIIKNKIKIIIHVIIIIIIIIITIIIIIIIIITYFRRVQYKVVCFASTQCKAFNFAVPYIK